MHLPSLHPMKLSSIQYVSGVQLIPRSHIIEDFGLVLATAHERDGHSLEDVQLLILLSPATPSTSKKGSRQNGFRSRRPESPCDCVESPPRGYSLIDRDHKLSMRVYCKDCRPFSGFNASFDTPIRRNESCCALTEQKYAT